MGSFGGTFERGRLNGSGVFVIAREKREEKVVILRFHHESPTCP
jgi:hypothetical protein